MILIPIIIIICLLIIFSIYLQYYNSPKLIIIDSKKPGKTLLIVGGTHGNEPAGFVASEQIIKELNHNMLKSGKIIIIPDANTLGLKMNMRYMPIELMSFSILGHPDLNRSYAVNNKKAKSHVADKIGQLAKSADWVIDLHEGWSFYKQNPKSMGSGIYPGKSTESHNVVPSLLNAVNNTIKREDYKFVSLDWPDLHGTLRMLCDENNIHYTLVETSGQNDIQPIHIRSNQHKIIIYDLLKQLNII